MSQFRNVVAGHGSETHCVNVELENLKKKGSGGGLF